MLDYYPLCHYEFYSGTVISVYFVDFNRTTLSDFFQNLCRCGLALSSLASMVRNCVAGLLLRSSMFLFYLMLMEQERVKTADRGIQAPVHPESECCMSEEAAPSG